MSAILYNTINTLAELSYKGPEISAANYDIWVKHWFACADLVAQDFAKEGLPATAQAVSKIIVEQKQLIRYNEDKIG